MDGLSALVEEVALEGLDGITLPSLWIRLEDRKPKFPLKLDELTKAFLWSALVHSPEVSFYEQPRERDDVELYDRFENIDPDTGIEVVGQSFKPRKDVYEALIIQDNPNGIQGSCAFFRQRKDVSAQIRSNVSTPLHSLQQAWDRFGRRLVIVASQKVRFRALIGSESDPDLKLTDESYCILEKVGRARWHGELQRDLHNGSFKIDSRKIHYLRKALVRHNLVTVQSHVCRVSSGLQQHSCLLLLRKFHTVRRSKYDILMERVSHILEASPDWQCTQITLRNHLNLEDQSFKRLIHYMRGSKMVEQFSKTAEELNPEGGPCLTKKGNKVQVRCIKLVKPFSQKNIPDDDEEDDEERGDGRPEGRIMERDVLSQAYSMVVSSGTKGMTCMGIGKRLNVGKLERRMICRQLEREGVVKGFMEDEGRQRTTKFISHRAVEVNDKLHQFVKEHERSRLLCSSAATPDSPGPLQSSLPETPMTNMDVCRILKITKTQTRKKRKEIKKMKEMRALEKVGATETEQLADHEEQITEPVVVAAATEEEKSPSAPPQRKESSDPPPAVITNVQPTLLYTNYETCRLLRRKNLILEAIQRMKIFEGLFPLQKIINAEEKAQGLNSKCCKKTILRLVHSLAREGQAKIYTTVVIQDGVSRKVDLYTHPSIQPSDEIVQTILDQVRFKMSSSYSVSSGCSVSSFKGETSKDSETSTKTSRAHRKTNKRLRKDTFKPITVPGISRTYGYQPKMHRLRVVQNFLWYLVYGHPLQHNPQTQAFEKAQPVSPLPPQSEQEAPNDIQATESEECTQSPAKNMTLSEDEEETPQTPFKVYSEELSWKRFIPPVRVHKNYSRGWVMLGDLLLCLPLSIYTQVIQVNYKVDGLEEYLNDPEKQHYLVRFLPPTMKRQLLNKRRYIFSFYESLQRLCFMGLIQFAPQEKFRDKDQVIVYVRRHATIVDTIPSEPHYWLVSEPEQQPFDRRHYTFKTHEDLENYWFDLMCICLDTPLGVIRGKRDAQPSFVKERNVFVGMAHHMKGSLEAVDDGSIPGDGKGAGGLDSNFFSHLKRNWFWTNQLLTDSKKSHQKNSVAGTVRLKSLCRSSLQLVLQAEKATKSYVTPKRPIVTVEDVQMVEEPSSRNKQVIGGKQQKRKRTKKAVVKAPRKKKEPKKRGKPHDEGDHEALKHMTRQRVFWSPQEDSLLMLCAVATHLFNSKLKRPFVPYVVVRNVLHKEFKASKDKTSLAVSRRCRYILKNKQTILNYRICLAEVGQDKALLRLLEKNRPEDPEQPELCSKSFSEFIRLLREKFSTTIDPNSLEIPDNKDLLFSQFKVLAIDNSKKMSYVDSLNSTEDIQAIVLHNLIQSTLAMTNSQMKSVRSFQTFHIYSGYSQELLCQVFLQCRKKTLLNRRRVTQGIEPKKNRALPILPMSYQLSQCYYRHFSWRFPQVLCTDAFRLVRNLHNLPKDDHRPFTYFHQETENRGVNGEIQEIKKKPPQKPAQEMNQCDQSKSENLEAEMDVEEQTVADSVDGPDVSNMLQFTLDSPGGFCAAILSLMSLGLVSVHMSIPKQLVVVDSALVDTDTVKSVLEDEEEDEEEGEEPKRMEVKAQHNSASHTKYLMMRGYCIPGIVSVRKLNVTDSIVVESCIMRFQMRDSRAHELFSLDAEPPLDLWRCGPSLVPAALTLSLTSPPLSVDECLARLQHRGYSGPDLEACALLWDTLDRAGERGLDLRQFCQRHMELERAQPPRTRTLQQYMQDLQQESQVVLVGAWGARWVLRAHALPWLISINNSMWSSASHENLPFIRHRHDIPFIRKKRTLSRGREKHEPPAKQKKTEEEEEEEGGERAAEEEMKEATGNREEQEKQESGVKGETSAEEGKGTEENRQEKVTEEELSAPTEEKQQSGAEEIRGGEGEMSSQPEEQQEKTTEEEKSAEKNEKKPEKAGKRRRRVAQSCTNPCCVPKVPAEASPGDEVSFVARPWRMVDGKLNRIMCKGMLEGVLQHIMLSPGLTQEALLQHYRDILQPTATLELLQALSDLGCVKKRTLVKRPKPSLFSRPSPAAAQGGSRCDGSGPGVALEPPDTVFYEPTLSCVLRLSHVLPHERLWNTEANT